MISIHYICLLSQLITFIFMNNSWYFIEIIWKLFLVSITEQLLPSILFPSSINLSIPFLSCLQSTHPFTPTLPHLSIPILHHPFIPTLPHHSGTHTLQPIYCSPTPILHTLISFILTDYGAPKAQASSNDSRISNLLPHFIIS